MTDPLDRAMHHARAWLDGLDAAPVGGHATADALRDALGGPLPETGSDQAASSTRLQKAHCRACTPMPVAGSLPG